MYDKYFQANPITIGSRIPKHKGILFSGGTAGTVSSTIHLVKVDGATAALGLVVNQIPYILPMQVYTVTALAPGVTAWYIN